VSATPAEVEPDSPAPAAAGRDLRLDLLRGLFVFLMIVGHLGWRRLAPHFPLGFVTAAEGFFFVSGATLGLVALRMRASGRGGAPFRRRLALRGLWLYALNLALAALAFALEAAPPFDAANVARQWGEAPAWQRLASLDQPLALNVLPRYAVFLLVAPLALVVVERARGPLVLALLSLSLWSANWLADGWLRPPVLETARAEFGLASWQLLFFGGLALASAFPPRMERDGRGGSTRTWLLVASALLAAGFVVAERWTPGTANSTRGPLAEWVERPTLGPLRMVNFAVGATLLWLLVDRWRGPIARWAGWLLLPLGRNAMPAFVLHLPLLWIGSSIPQSALPATRRQLAALAAALAISQIVRWKALRKLLLPV
jgi:hypothetical protein